MDTSDLIAQFLVTERLERARADARRRALVPAGEPLRARLGAFLIALGQRLQDIPAPHRATP